MFTLIFLKNNYNCYLTEKNEEKYWIELIQKVLKRSNFKKFRKKCDFNSKKIYMEQ